VEETSAADATEGASLASGLVVLVSAPPTLNLSAESLAKRQIIVPFVGCSTRYAILQSLPCCARWRYFGCLILSFFIIVDGH
jgi:hypothetical protein